MRFYFAKKERKCSRCGGKIPEGALLGKYRDRATCYYEACHAGSMYLMRNVCRECLKEWNLRGEDRIKLQDIEYKMALRARLADDKNTP
jgi:hypothetical protein